MDTLHVRRHDSVVVVEPTADLMGGVETQDLIAAVQSAVRESLQGIVVNLSMVHHVNSTGLGSLVQCVTAARAGETKMAFCRITPNLEKKFGLTLGHLVNGFSSEDEAIRYCSQR